MDECLPSIFRVQAASGYNLWSRGTAIDLGGQKGFGGLGHLPLGINNGRGRERHSFHSKAQERERVVDMVVGKQVPIDGALRAARALARVN